MCWSAPVSLAFGVSGVAVAAYAHHKKEPKELTVPLAYFASMELLQFVTYFYIDNCALPVNQWLTVLSYLHIAFQPAVFSMWMMYASKSKLTKLMKRVVYGISALVSAILLIKMIPIRPDSICEVGQTLCGPAWCSLTGNWHLAWSVPYYNFPIPGDGIIYYFIAAFGLPLLYGAWRSSAWGVFAIVLPVYLISGGNPQEWPAVWCLVSVAMMFAIILPAMRKHFVGKKR